MMNSGTRLFAAVLVLGAAVAASAQAPAKTQRPVVVELFTSEGCSSCPPADELLLQLEQHRNVDGVPVLVIGEHVDYWDHEGWRDRFSSREFTQRQQDYQQRLRFKEPYTPQAIVDGRIEVVGSDAAALTQAIHNAAAQTSPVELRLARGASGTVELTASNASRKKIHILLAVVESGLKSKVDAGENRGRELQDPAVLRRLISVATSADENIHKSTQVKFERDWNAGQIHLIALAQDADSGAILGAATDMAQ